MTHHNGINIFESFDPPSRHDGISALALAAKKPAESPAPIAHVTTHGDLFCVGCKQPERYDDGHEWLAIYETGARVDACDECNAILGGDG